MFRRYSYVPHRRLLYGLLWAIAVAELGLTGARIQFTRTNLGTHGMSYIPISLRSPLTNSPHPILDPIVAELLVVSILTILWVPVTLLFHRTAPGVGGSGTTGRRGFGGGGLYGGLHHESSGNFVLWVMWLVGAAIAAHTWPTRAIAGPGKEGRILITIVALAFVEFGLMTLAKVAALMEYAALGARGGAGVGTTSEKTAGNAPAATV